MNLLARLTRSALVGAALAAAVPAAASADLLTYADGNNVWVASPDGAVKRPLTTDGVASNYYKWPSADDAGNVVAVQGYSTTQAIVVLRPNGTRAVNVMPWNTSTTGNFGPTSARVKPTTGGQLAYTYDWNHGPYSGYPNGGVEPRFAVVKPDAPGDPGSPVIDQPGRDYPTWFGDRLVAGSGGDVVYEYEPLKFRSWLHDNTGSLIGGEVSRAGDRVLVAYSDGRLALLAYQGVVGDPNGGSVTDGCYVPTQPPAKGYITYALSPDGHRVAWGDAAGLHVASTEAHPGPGDGPCALQGHVLLSATGKQPAFSAAAAPANGGGPADPDPVVPDPKPGPGPKVNPDPRPQAQIVVVPTRTTVATLKRGLTVGYKARSAGTVTATLTAGGVLGRTTRVVKRAGSVKVTIRLSPAAQRKLARLKGKKVSLRLVFKPRKGRAVTTTRTLRVG